MSKKLKDGKVVKDHIVFDEKAHTYTNSYTGDVYPSVTTVIGKFKKKVDSDNLLDKTSAKIIATKYKGIPFDQHPSKDAIKAEILAKREELRIQWAKLADDAGKFGTRVHEILEDYSNGELEATDDKYNIILQNYISKFPKNPADTVLTEELVYSDKYKIAGLADRIIIHSDGTFSIEDYKTNKKFDRRAYDGGYGPEMMEFPFDGMESCHLSIYTIQLGIYAYLFSEATGRKLNKLRIFWYDRAAALPPHIQGTELKNILDNYDHLDGEWVMIECSYLMKKIKWLLENQHKIEAH